MTRILKASNPSESAKSSAYTKSQFDYSIIDGRYKANNPIRLFAPSLEIYHEAFRRFLDTVTNPQFIPDDDIIRKTVLYMIAASAVYTNEKERGAKLTPLLDQILDVNMQAIVNEDKTLADAIVELNIGGGNIVLLLREDKNEFGDGGSDPSTQAGLSAARYWAQTRVSECIFHHVLL